MIYCFSIRAEIIGDHLSSSLGFTFKLSFFSPVTECKMY